MHYITILTLALCVLFPGSVFAQAAETKSSPRLSYTTPLAERYNEDGLVFIVKEALLGEWLSMEQAQRLAIFSPTKKQPTSVLAIRYDFLNENFMKKVNLDRPFKFRLRDEYGNYYRQMEKPLNYHQTADYINISYPSVYPGERLGKTVFFEAPIKSSNILYFHIDARNIGLQRDVVFEIPRSRIVLLQEGFYDRLEEAKKKDADLKNQTGPIRIIKPKNGITVEPGQTIRVEVALHENSREPDNIFVMIPSYVLKDSERHYAYDLTVPKDGDSDQLTVLVIGQWLDGDEEEILSDSVVLNIFDTSSL